MRFFSLFILVFVAACSEQETASNSATPVDMFSYANTDQVVVSHIDLDLTINFEEKVLGGTAVLTLDYITRGAETLVLDARNLSIEKVEAGVGEMLSETTFSLSETDPVLGEALTIALPGGTDRVKITYGSNLGATGLMWLSPEQTAGKVYPFMFSQSQAIHARSWVPLQDTPAVRFSYTATLRTPENLIALMSSAQDPDGVRDGEYHFVMPQAIPSYLMAIAVGDLEFRAISETIGVYAESYIIDAAVYEFGEAPDMMIANEALYGPYRWGRYDLLILPPSFPFGGMENPRLTFLTPTLVAGDRSLTNVIAHELAHSWAGNQVTNATWREPWLNEGITSYVENRVMEEVYGTERAVMEQIMAKADWMADLADFEENNELPLAALKLPEKFDDPDLGFSSVAYNKGQFFMMFLEQSYGRDVFDPFLKGYFDNFAFKSLTTEDFLAYLKENLMEPNPGVVAEAVIMEWIYEPSVPASTPNPVSDVFERLEVKSAAWLAGEIDPNGLDSAAWTIQEWLYFLNGLPDELTQDQFISLDTAFNLTNSSNAEVVFVWYMKSLKGGYGAIDDSLKKFLIRVGRGKFLYPLYARLIETGKAEWAMEIYQEARAGYHPIAQSRIETLFADE
ncbi:MAG: M1 family metallopeptidase [Alphaproteobacteria bacterium]